MMFGATRTTLSRAWLRSVCSAGAPRCRRVLVVSARIAASLAFFCFCRASYAQSGETVTASDTLRQAVDGELKAQANDHTQWTYEVTARDSGKEQVKKVIETTEGDVERLRSVNGQPITQEESMREDHRIDNLVHNRREQRKLQREKEEDSQRVEHLFKMLPEAVTARYGSRQGGLAQILFAPDPTFHPASHEEAVFHGMEGSIWIDTQQNRLAEIEGHLVETIKFGGGLLGHLDKGGEFHVKQSEVAPGHWEITLMKVDMRGKALFFKTIGVQQNETQSGFHRVPKGLTLSQAAEELRGSQSAGTSGK
jgi:hypothetical protein